MNTSRSWSQFVPGVALVAIACVASSMALPADPRAASPSTAVDPVVLASIRDSAMSSNWAWNQLEDLTDTIGPRMSGSPQLEAAIQRVAATMRSLGAHVTLQPARVTHWVRGDESAELVDYARRPEGAVQKLHLTALGMSGTTTPAGLTAPIVVVRDIDDLKSRARGEIAGKIVVFSGKFDQRLADNGQAGAAYGYATTIRSRGPAAASALGAVAALVRTAGDGELRSPHTGGTYFTDRKSAIPAAALASEDTDLIVRLARKGPVSIKLVLVSQMLGEADSFNVIADWPGREKPDEYVLVSGHLDSWDLGTGAVDDGAGVMGAAGVIETLRKLNLHARRTIRFVAWTDEETGGIGGIAYFKALADQGAAHAAAIESDAGAGRAIGVKAAVTEDSYAKLKPVIDALRPIGATVLQTSGLQREVGTDIEPLQNAGTPGFAPLVDTRHYFDIHHSAADTLDKVDPVNLQTHVATMAVLAYWLAESPEPLPRLAPITE